MTAVELLERESSQPVNLPHVASGQIGAVSVNEVEAHILLPHAAERAEAAWGDIGQHILLDGSPTAALINHRGKLRPSLVTHKTEQNGALEWQTLSIQDIVRDSMTHVLHSHARSLIKPLNGKHAGRIISEVHMRPDDLDPIDTRFLRPFLVDDIQWFEHLAYTLERHKVALR